MKNIDRIAINFAKHGDKGILIHTLPDSGNWIMAQKIEESKWMLTLFNPMGSTTYNLGIVTDEQHTALWNIITNMEIEKKITQLKLAKELKTRINNFIKNYEKQKTYKKFIKIEKETPKKNKHLGCRTSKTKISNTNSRISNAIIQKRTQK